MTQLYDSILNAFIVFPKLIRNRTQKRVDPKLIERLMLATTEVNGCDICSYAHTQMALKEGFSLDEIEAFLSGSRAYVNKKEALAILYAQHVADTMGQPDPEAFNRLIQEYGSEEAEIMNAGIKVMMMGNISGIPISALIRRFQGHAYSNSSLFYELSMISVQPIFFVVASVHTLINLLFRIQNKTP